MSLNFENKLRAETVFVLMIAFSILNVKVASDFAARDNRSDKVIGRLCGDVLLYAPAMLVFCPLLAIYDE